MDVGEFIKELRKKHGMTQVDLAKKLDIVPTAVSAWERGENRPLIDKIVQMASIFEVSVADFFGDLFEQVSTDVEMIPVVGRISCGNGVIAYEDIEGYEATPKDWLNGGEYFYLRAKGDSMTGVRIHDGDLLLIRKQPEVENGEIAAVLIEDEAVLKRVYRSGDQLLLQSENPSYPPIFAPPAEVKIIGRLRLNVVKYF